MYPKSLRFLFVYHFVSGFSNTVTRFGNSLGGTTVFSIVELSDMIYYSGRIQGKTSKDGMKYGGNQAQAPKGLPPVKSHTGIHFFQQQAVREHL